MIGPGVVVASPYMKADALERFLEHVALDASLTCVTRWKPQDVATGASDVRCREIVLERGGEFLLHPTLHAKYYRFDKHILIGSANLTMSGMGWGANPNLEILASPSSEFDWQSFEAELLSRARPVSDIEYALWATIQPAPLAKDAPLPQGSQNPDWRPVTREFIHVAMLYYGRMQDIASSDEQRRAHVDIANLSLPTNLDVDQFRLLALMSLISSSYAADVLRVQHMDSVDAARELGELHRLPFNIALRQMQTIHNWLRELAPELLPPNT